MRMKRSQLKDLIKECLVEILQEDRLLERAVAGTMRETAMLPAPQQRQQYQQQQQYYNPFDDGAMSQRQHAMMNNSMQQQQLMRQSQNMNRGGGDPSNMAMLAGLDGPPGGGYEPSGPSRYEGRDAGVRNPSDYLNMAGPMRPKYDPSLDVPVAGSTPQQQHRQRFIPEAAHHHHTPQQQRQHHDPYSQLGQSAPLDESGFPSPEILKNVLDDTWNTTVQEQAAKGHRHPGHIGEQTFNGGMSADIDNPFASVASQHNPDQLFPEAAGNWAALAFDK